MAGIGDQCRRLDLCPGAKLVAGHDTIRGDADNGTDHARAEMTGRAVMGEFVEAFDTGEDRARPNHHRDRESGHVLGPVVAVRERVRARTLREPEPGEQHHACRHVRQVVQRITQQADRTGDERDTKFLRSPAAPNPTAE